MEKALAENMFKDEQVAPCRKGIEAKRYKHESETKTEQHCALGMGNTSVRWSWDVREGMIGGHLGGNGSPLRKTFI